MADSIRTKTLDGVLVQENGIIRNSKGYFLARLEYETEFDSEHINENPVSLADQLAAAQAESEDLSYELASAKAEIASWAKRWPETCASLENLQAELTGKKLELRRVRKFLEEAQAKIAQLRSAWEDEGWSGSTAVRSDYVVCPGCGQNHDGDTVEFVDISEGMQGEDQLTYRCPAPNAPRDLHTSTVFRSRRHLRRRKEEDSRYPLLKGDRT